MRIYFNISENTHNWTTLNYIDANRKESDVSSFDMLVIESLYVRKNEEKVLNMNQENVLNSFFCYLVEVFP